MAEPLYNLRAAYYELERKVARALRTQLGDEQRLRTQQREVLRFVDDATVVSNLDTPLFNRGKLTRCCPQHSALFSAEEFGNLQTSANNMLTMLDNACHESTDPPDGPTLFIAKRVRTGKRGRPKLHIDPGFLAEALTLRGPTGIAPVLACSSRTIRRRAVELSIAAPAQPVYRTTIHADGHTTRTYNTQRVRRQSTITDTQLDAMVLEVLTDFPAFGRSMLAGRLQAQGHVVHRDRLRAAYIRVNGTPVAWGNRVVDRRGYHVAGANSLWHHDGQHGMQCSSLHYSSEILIPHSQDSSNIKSSNTVSSMGKHAL